MQTRSLRRLLGRPLLFSLGLGSLLVGFLVDMETDRQLVVAITYVIPIALSALAFSRSLTLTLMGAALVFTAVAGVENALIEGVDEAAILNRILATVSFTLVGVFALLLHRSTKRVTFLQGESERADYEAGLRQLLTNLSRAETQPELLREAAKGLQPLFGAARVTITGMRKGEFAAPIYSYPSPSHEFQQGRRLPWMATACSDAPARVIATWHGGVQLAAGQLNAPILIERPTESSSTRRLGEVLEGLEPLLEHVTKLEAARPPAQPRAALKS
jgi:hypothetical protein